MKRGQRLIIVCLNQASVGASEALHETMYNKLPEAIRQVVRAQSHLNQALAYLKGLAKSQEERG